MRPLARLAPVACLAACITHAAPITPAVTPAPAKSTPVCPDWADDPRAHIERLELGLVELVNEARQARGAPRVTLEPRLALVARAHSERMAGLRTMAHVTDGESAEDRLRAARILDWDAVGENIAMGRSINYTAESPPGRHRTVACHDSGSLAREIFRAWYASPGHRQTLLDARFTHVGSGAAYEAADETVYVTHDFTHLVSCGYTGAACCPPPEGATGGICQRPNRCRAGTCVPQADAAPASQ